MSQNSHEQALKILSSFSHFQKLQKQPKLREFISKLLPTVSYEKVQRGKAIYHHGDYGDKFYIILKGEICEYSPKSSEDIQKQKYWKQHIDQLKLQSRLPQKSKAALESIIFQLEKAELIPNFYRKEQQDDLLFLEQKHQAKYQFFGTSMLQQTARFITGQSFGVQVIQSKDRTQRTTTAIAASDSHLISISGRSYKYIFSTMLKKIELISKVIPKGDQDLIQSFAINFQENQYNSRDFLCVEGNNMQKIFVVRNGKVQLRKFVGTSQNQQRDYLRLAIKTRNFQHSQLIATLGPGDVFGHENMSMNGIYHHHYTVIVSKDVKDCQVFEISRSDFYKVEYLPITREMQIDGTAKHNLYKWRLAQLMELKGGGSNLTSTMISQLFDPFSTNKNNQNSTKYYQMDEEIDLKSPNSITNLHNFNNQKSIVFAQEEQKTTPGIIKKNSDTNLDLAPLQNLNINQIPEPQLQRPQTMRNSIKQPNSFRITATSPRNRISMHNVGPSSTAAKTGNNNNSQQKQERAKSPVTPQAGLLQKQKSVRFVKVQSDANIEAKKITDKIHVPQSNRVVVDDEEDHDFENMSDDENIFNDMKQKNNKHGGSSQMRIRFVQNLESGGNQDIQVDNMDIIDFQMPDNQKDQLAILAAESIKKYRNYLKDKFVLQNNPTSYKTDLSNKNQQRDTIQYNQNL